MDLGQQERERMGGIYGLVSRERKKRGRGVAYATESLGL